MKGKSLLGIIVMMLAIFLMPTGILVHAEPGDGEQSYKVTFDAGEGYLNCNPTMKEYDEYAMLGGYVDVPVSDGYSNYTSDGKVISGWYMDKTFTQEANVVNGDQYYPTGNVTLYAKWEEGAKVTFDFCEADEAYSGDEYVHTYYMKKNNYINAYNDLEGATFGNMVFYGWYTDEERGSLTPKIAETQ
ncbi:InlB B-repeat-containing protein [Butyrivibrio sp. WCD3002]|uniref:InlB B-repeat-containing protein n=1 Tax=Butyrivibrio sp. WCD3002 TaxID=1280676 RepID=UPI0004158113|nr:InlB B-repeat-containing protein [Butyrivibrio sp. WCD3002]